MAIADPHYLYVFSEASGTSVPDETGNGHHGSVNTTNSPVENTDYEWAQDVAPNGGHLKMLTQNGASMPWIDCPASGLTTTMQAQSFAYGFNLTSFRTGAYLKYASAAHVRNGGVSMQILAPTSTGDFNLVARILDTSGFGQTSTFEDLGFGADYNLSVSWSGATSPTGRARINAGATVSDSTTYSVGTTIAADAGSIGRQRGFTTDTGSVCEHQYYAEWRGYELTDAETLAVNADPAGEIPTWPSSSTPHAGTGVTGTVTVLGVAGALTAQTIISVPDPISDVSGTIRASLTGIRASWYDSDDASSLGTAVATWTGLTTDGSGNLEALDISGTSLAVGEWGRLVIDGNSGAWTAHYRLQR